MSRAAHRNPQLSAAGSVGAGILALFVLVGGFGSWAAWTRIAGAIIAPGQIEVEKNRQVVQHPEGGVVAAILVRDGDKVTAGETLLRLDTSALGSRLAIVTDQFFEVRARRHWLEAERDGSAAVTFSADLIRAATTDPDVRDVLRGQERLFTARATSFRHEVAQLAKRRGQIENQIAGIGVQERAVQTQIQLIGRELSSQQVLLERGLAQLARVLALQREAARLEGAMGILAAETARFQGQITEIEVEILKLGSGRRETAITRLRDLQFREFELAEERAALAERSARLEIRAPVSGVVHGLEVFAERAVIRAGAAILYLVPQDRPLIIASRLSPIHVDQVFTGQEVHLRFSAFDARDTPALRGRVSKISADAFTDERTEERFYRTEVELLEGEAGRLSDAQPLIPGMPVEVFFRTEDRTPLEYLVEPLADYFVRAFRES